MSDPVEWSSAVSPEVQAQMDTNPKLAEAIAKTMAELTEALRGCATQEQAEEVMRRFGAVQVVDDE